MTPARCVYPSVFVCLGMRILACHLAQLQTWHAVFQVAAAAAFNLLLVFAFLAPTRGAVAMVVREKELRLREGMRILGLQARKTHPSTCCVTVQY